MSRKKQKPEQEKDISAKTRSEVLADIQRLEKAGDANELGSYLIELSKWGEKPQQYENVLRNYLYSPEARLSEAAVFSLLFALQIKKDEYRACALKQLLEGEEEYEGSRFDAQQWAAASLAVAYQGTKDKELLRIFFSFLDDEATDKLLKSSFAGDVLLVWGVSSREQHFRCDTVSAKALLREFDTEFSAARKLIAD